MQAPFAETVSPRFVAARIALEIGEGWGFVT
jgi:hypothetical protein